MNTTSLRALALAAIQSAIDNVPQSDCSIYYGKGVVPEGKEPCVATAHCREWAEYLHDLNPATVLRLLDVLDAARAADDWLRYVTTNNPDVFSSMVVAGRVPSHSSMYAGSKALRDALVALDAEVGEG